MFPILTIFRFPLLVLLQLGSFVTILYTEYDIYINLQEGFYILETGKHKLAITKNGKRRK